MIKAPRGTFKYFKAIFEMRCDIRPSAGFVDYFGRTFVLVMLNDFKASSFTFSSSVDAIVYSKRHVCMYIKTDKFTTSSSFKSTLIRFA